MTTSWTASRSGGRPTSACARDCASRHEAVGAPRRGDRGRPRCAALMLEHTRDQWLPEHHAITAGMFHALVEMRRRLEERSATLTRLRRLFGIRTTEKLDA